MYISFFPLQLWRLLAKSSLGCTWTDSGKRASINLINSGKVFPKRAMHFLPKISSGNSLIISGRDFPSHAPPLITEGKPSTAEISQDSPMPSLGQSLPSVHFPPPHRRYWYCDTNAREEKQTYYKQKYLFSKGNQTRKRKIAQKKYLIPKKNKRQRNCWAPAKTQRGLSLYCHR